MIPNATFRDVPDPFAFIVPGGVMPTVRALRNQTIRAYVRSAAETAEVVASVCTGALILASVGLSKVGGRAPTGPSTRSWSSSEQRMSANGG